MRMTESPVVIDNLCHNYGEHIVYRGFSLDF